MLLLHIVVCCSGSWWEDCRSLISSSNKSVAWRGCFQVWHQGFRKKCFSAFAGIRARRRFQTYPLWGAFSEKCSFGLCGFRENTGFLWTQGWTTSILRFHKILFSCHYGFHGSMLPSENTYVLPGPKHKSQLVFSPCFYIIWFYLVYLAFSAALLLLFPLTDWRAAVLPCCSSSN